MSLKSAGGVVEWRMMKFDELNSHIPKGSPGKAHSETLEIAEGDGWKVRVKYPGKYGPDDYVVQVKSKGVWDRIKSFTHGDFFNDLALKVDADHDFILKDWLPHALKVVQGVEPPSDKLESKELPGINITALTVGTQALAVCEFRRYPQGDDRGGGRYLPLNYTSAMLHRYWTADRAWQMMRVGLPALRQLHGFRPFRHIDDVDIYLATIKMADADT